MWHPETAQLEMGSLLAYASSEGAVKGNAVHVPWAENL
jgi:hypothetical protein